MTREQHNLAALIAFTVVTDKHGLTKLLNSKGYSIDPDAPDEAISDATVDAFATNPDFQQQFVSFFKLKGQKQPTARSENFMNDDGVSAATSSGFWGGLNAGTVLNFLGTGATVYGGLKAADANANATKAQAAALIAQAKAQTEANLSALELAKLQLAAQAAKPKDNTILYIGLSVAAVALLGTVIFFATRKS